ncbi:MAG: CHAT domain-containing protein [Oscillatoriales cyanobacterium C42_A2020_001]|nr:CHAT domain-containing protein [Leptolyngbyaceae cyanobacterium C42_A2020_001]
MNCFCDRGFDFAAPFKALFPALSFTWIAGLLSPSLVHAQLIVPAPDGTGTYTVVENNQITINGGRVSGNGANLFHSFAEFGLSRGQVATFLANPTIQNILARVTGGNVSIIDGRIQVAGGNSNLFLLNPAGILFGPNASLNVPASFTATTANRLGFGNASSDSLNDGSLWFNANAANDYSSLNGQPTVYAFTSVAPGAIANFGNLAVPTGQALLLLAGNVLNVGQLSAPSGQITVASVPGQNLVRISQPGSLLSLELGPITTADIGLVTPSPRSLPQLLTGGTLDNATQVTVNSDGSLRLAGASLSLPTASGTTLISGQVSVSDLTPDLAPGSINLLGTNVALVQAAIAASGTNGGTIRIGGDYQGQGTVPNAMSTFVDSSTQISANGLAPGFSNGGKVIIWADDTTRFSGSIFARGGDRGGNGGLVEVSGKRNLVYQGQTDTSAPAGRSGTLLLDPTNIEIVPGASAPNDIDLETNGQIFASDPGETFRLSQTTLDLITGDVILQATNDIRVLLPPNQVLTFSAATSVTFTTDADQNGFGSFVAPPSVVLKTSDLAKTSITISGASILVGDIDTSTRLDDGGDVTLSASVGNVTVGSINTRTIAASGQGGRGGDVILRSDRGSILAGQIITTGTVQAGDVELSAPGFREDVRFGSINTTSALGLGGNVTLQAGRFVEGSGFIAGTASPTINTTGAIAPGNVLITYGGGGLRVPFVVGNRTQNGTAGAILAGVEALTPPPLLVFPEGYRSPSGTIQIRTLTLPGVRPRNQDELADEIEPNDEEEEQFDDFANANLPDLNALEGEFEESAEEEFTEEFEAYLGVEAELGNRPTINESLRQVEATTGVRPALVYLNFVPATVATQRLESASLPIATRRLQTATMTALTAASSPQSTMNSQEIWRFGGTEIASDRLIAQTPPVHSRGRASEQATDQLELLVITAEGRPIRKLVAGVTRDRVLATVQSFLNEITDPRKTRTQTYLAPAQQLYQWLIAPIETELQARRVTNLAFIADSGLRFIPLAALHDGQRFLIERYSLGLMPSLSLTNTRFVSVKDAQVLAMGASEFTDQPPLPAVPTELSIITNRLRAGRAFLNQDFTLSNLQAQRQQGAFRIVHLATHGEFQPGALSNSYIQLWDMQLRMDQLRQLGWSNPPVELLVLSACRTAFGNDDAELGFAGFAVQAGVKSALASLWYVSDEGTLGLMTEFYRRLQTAPIKAEALRQAQIAMAQGQVKFEVGRLRDASGQDIPLPPALVQLSNPNLSHPYYWAAFTMIGSPW